MYYSKGVLLDENHIFILSHKILEVDWLRNVWGNIVSLLEQMSHPPR